MSLLIVGAGWTITFGGQASNMYILIISILIYSATVREREMSFPVEIILHVPVLRFLHTPRDDMRGLRTALCSPYACVRDRPIQLTAWMWGALFAVFPFFGLDDFKYVPAGAYASHAHLRLFLTLARPTLRRVAHTVMRGV
jgi:hypothetical protein